MNRITSILLSVMMAAIPAMADQQLNPGQMLPSEREIRVEPTTQFIHTDHRAASPLYVPTTRENRVTLVDSSLNGYGMLTADNNPLSWDPVNNHLLLTYRKWAGLTASSGILGAGISDDEGQTFSIYNNLNQGTTLQQARYPSAVATPDYPIVIWNEYGGGGGTYGGRAYYTFDEGEYGAGIFAPPSDLHNNPTANDLWQGSPSVSYSDDGSMYLNVMFANWSSPTNKFIFHSSTNGAWDGTSLSWTLPNMIVNEADFLTGVTSNYLSNGSIDINDDGVGYFVASGYWQDTTLIQTHTLFVKQTLDYGVTWSDWYHVPDSVMIPFFRSAIPDSIYDETNDSWVTLDPNWLPFVNYDLDVLADENGGCHIIAGVLPSQQGGVFPGWAEENGLYHFYSPQDDLFNWDINFVASLLNPWLLTDPGWQGVFPNIARDIVLENTLYISWYTWPDINSPIPYFDVMAAYSTDNGTTWSAPVNITDTPSTSFDEIDPHLARRATNGKVYMMYQMPDYNYPTVNPPGTSEDYKNRIYFRSHNFFGESDADLTAGSGCEDWTDPIVINSILGEFSSDGVSTPLEPDYYYINSVIRNIGSEDANFQPGQTVWRILVDGEPLQNWGSFSEQRISRSPQDLNRLRQRQNFLQSQTMFSPLIHGPFASYNADASAIQEHQIKATRSTQTMTSISPAIELLENRDAIYTTSFESWPDGWTINDVTTGSTWFQSDADSYDGTYSACISADEEMQMKGLKSPVMDLSDLAGQDLVLSFFERDDYPGGFLFHEVLVYVNGMWDTSFELSGPAGEWNQTTLDLSAYAGVSNFQLEFFFWGLYPDVWYVDQVSLSSSSTTIPITIPAGECQAGYGFDPVYLAPGEHEIQLEIDPDNVLTESDENNNVYTRPLSVVGPTLPENMLWSQLYGNAGIDNISGVKSTPDDGYILIGYTDDGNLFNDWDAILIKTNAAGDTLWTRRFGGEGDDVLYHILPTPDGGYLLSGMTNSSSLGLFQGWAVKVDNFGNMQWEQAYGENDQLAVYGSQLNPEGGYILAGYGHFLHSTGSNNDGWVGWINESGTLLNEMNYDGGDDEMFTFLTPVQDGGFILGGVTTSAPSGIDDGWLLKIDANGNVIWEDTYGGAQEDYFSGIITTDDGGFILSGKTASVEAGDTDGWVMKIDENGDELWNHTFGTTQTEWFNTIIPAGDGGAVLAGNSESLSQDSLIVYLVRIDANGNHLWSSVFDELPNYYISWPQTIAGTLETGFVIAGGNNAYNPSERTGWLGKLLPQTGTGPYFQLLQPALGAYVASQTPELTWESAGTTAVAYTVEVGSSIQALAQHEVGEATQFQIPLPLTDDTEYFWKVTAFSANGGMIPNGGGISSFAVNLENDPPEPGSLVSPPHGSVAGTLTPEFLWEPGSDPDPYDSLSYKIWIDSDSTFSNSLTLESATNQMTLPSPLDENGGYYWKVEFLDNSESSVFTEVRRLWINTEPEAPHAFDLVSPQDGIQGLEGRPEFIWTTAMDTDPLDNVEYDLVIATDSNFTTITLSNPGLLDTSFMITSDLPTHTQYWWKVVAMDRDSLTTESPVQTFTVGYVSTNAELAIPDEYALHPNYPNPFNPSTTIKYDLPEAGHVRLSVYNQLGQPVRTLVNRHLTAGYQAVVWDGRDAYGRQVSTGIYFYRLEANGFTQSKKMVFLK